MIEQQTPTEVVFVWGAITGIVCFIVITILGAVFGGSRDTCHHRWKPWSEPDGQGNQVRRCVKCNLQDVSKGDGK